MRIDKFLSNMGLGSRKEVKEFIKKGLIKVNGLVISKGTEKIDPDKDQVSFDNSLIEYERYSYLMLNKPQGYISATQAYGEKTVIDLLEEKYKNRGIFPAGRLDKDTEGLIFLTNDGRLAHNLLSPKKAVVKKYYAKVDRPLENKDIQKFETGIYLDTEQYLTLPAKLEIISDYECFVYIEEGKYHQVKRMLASCGKNVTYLKRLSIGPLILDEGLELGQYRKLTGDEISSLRSATAACVYRREDHMSKEEMNKKKIKAEMSQRDVGTSEKPSSDLYSSIKSRDEETGIEYPTDEAVEEAREWIEENRK